MVNNFIEKWVKIMKRNFTNDDAKAFNGICKDRKANYNLHGMPYHFPHNCGEDMEISNHSHSPNGQADWQNHGGKALA